MGCSCSSAKASKSNASKSGNAAAEPVPKMELSKNANLAELLGPTLLTKAGEVPTADVVQGKGVVALYFSAHWCPPCRGFTPQLAQWYSSNLKAKGLEVVFVSSDQDSNQFEAYYRDMPWAALPFEDRSRKDALSKRFKVQGIPSLVLLDSNGKIITSDGRQAVSQDPVGANFPWRPKCFNEIMNGASLIDGSGGHVGFDSLAGKVLAIYFSAHWCPPCRGFTPQLSKWYVQDLKDKGMEIVFVSSDKDQSSFDEYFREMPWLALEYSDRGRKDELSTAFGVQGIPSLVIVDGNGKTITKDGRTAISSDPTGTEFPWHRKPLFNLKDGPGDLNDLPCIIAFCEGADKDQQQMICNALTPVSQKYLEKQQVAGDDEPAYAFMIATESGGITDRLRDLLQLPGDKAAPRMVLVDISDDGAFYEGPEGGMSSADVEKLISGYETSALERRQLKQTQ